MTELEILARNADGLKKLPGVAWRALANPLPTPFERRDARSQIHLYGGELRRHYQVMEAERGRSRQQALNKNDGGNSGKPEPVSPVAAGPGPQTQEK